VVGSHTATEHIETGMDVTIDCSQGEAGAVYKVQGPCFSCCFDT